MSCCLTSVLILNKRGTLKTASKKINVAITGIGTLTALMTMRHATDWATETYRNVFQKRIEYTEYVSVLPDELNHGKVYWPGLG